MSKIVCEECGREISRKSAYTIKNGTKICADCYELIHNKRANTFVCERCGNLVDKEDISFEDGQYVCVDCLDI